MEETQEGSLVRGLVAMKDEAWAEFAACYYRPLVAFVRSRFGCGEELSQEIVQMTFVRCVKSIGTFDPSRGRLFTWLKAVAANEGHTLQRDSIRDREVTLSNMPEELLAEVSREIDTVRLPEEILARKDFQSAVRDALMSLSPAYSRALVMKYIDGARVREVASALGISEKAAESVLSRSRDAFRKVFLAKSKGGDWQEELR